MGAIAAFLNALISASMVAVAVLWIGPDAMRDPDQMSEAAKDRPAAFVTQDGLKLASVAVSLILIIALARHIHSEARRGTRGLIGVGMAGEVVLLANAVLSLLAFTAMGSPGVLTMIGVTALVSLVISGVWLMLVNAVAWRRGRLPLALCVTGLLAGVASISVPVFPPVSLASVVLGIVWSVWLGFVLWPVSTQDRP